MQLLRRLSFTMLLMSMMTLVACGGGDITGGGDDSGTDPVEDITVTVSKSDGELSSANTITVFAVVLDNQSPVANKTVMFSLGLEGSATLDPVSGAATTDANGLASIVVKVTDVPGSVSVVATYGSVSDDISFNSLGDGVQVVEGEPEAASIKLFASSQQLASSGAESIELIAVAKDENNHLLEGVSIYFSTDSGYLGADEGSTNVTDSNGQVKKYLLTQAEPSNRTIMATVTSGDITDQLEIEVVGTALAITGTASLALNDEAIYIINLVDSDGNGIAKTDIAVSLSGTGADLTIPSSVTTDSVGQATLSVTGTSGGDNTIVVSALGTSASQDVSVQSDSFLFTSFSNGDTTVNPSISPEIPDVSLTQTASVTLTWLREDDPVPNTPVNITTTRGILSDSSASTDSNGRVTVTLTSTDAGKALVTLVGTDTVSDNDIELTNQLEFEFYAEDAATITVQASPNSIGPNEQTSTISVVVKDDNGNLVKNKKVQFLLTDISGGKIFPATAVTDSTGSASTVYTSNSTSAKDAVVITAVVEDNTDVSDDVSLTVSNRELFISLGTGNELEESGSTDYIKEYSIFVTDADSNAVENVDLTISAIPEKYYKGFWVPTYDGDEFIAWVTAGYNSQTSVLPTHQCSNEDLNFNGILDDGEDTNGDGELTPGNIVSISGTFTTDSDGRSIIRINYPQSYGHWLDVKLVVSGKVTGSESSTQTIFKLPVLASDVTDEDVQPPQQGIYSRGPFGVIDDCTVAISDDPDSNTE